MDLTQIKGLGERMAQKIVQQLGGEQELEIAVKNFEVDRISSIEGISQRKAV
ncbi:MAG: helix-hairpin-helix domain-containing protein, partial [Methanobacteriaceae archaeon]|nr:helix-hairpin-helix domain-containing protein [Methanobacteriaceae archaeon]